MSRWATVNVRVSGLLMTTEPLHVGGIGGDSVVDMALAVDGAGRFVVPGTGLTGALRQWCLSEWGEDDTSTLWGFIEPHSDGGQASRIQVEDAPVFGTDGHSPAALAFVRTGVGIDRFTGTAARAVLATRSVLPTGVRLAFELTLNCKDEQESSRLRPLVARLLTALTTTGIHLGGGTTTGLGHAVLEADGATAVEQDLSTPAGVRAWSSGLSAESLTAWLERNNPEPLSAGGVLHVRLPLVAAGSLLVKRNAEGDLIDTMPLVEPDADGRWWSVIPGTSVKGSLRSHAERIYRTALARPLPVSTGERGLHLEQLSGLPLIDALFGKVNDSDTDSPDHHGKGALRPTTCKATKEVPAGWITDWLAHLELPPSSADGHENKVDALTVQQVEELRANGYRPADHVAIDRWTGGAADARLFSVLEQHLEWNPVELTIDLRRLSHDDSGASERDAALALVYLLIRDLQSGRVGLGFGTTRGHGWVHVEGPVVTGLPGHVDPVDFDDIPLPVVEELDRAWRRHLQAIRTDSGAA